MWREGASAAPDPGWPNAPTYLRLGIPPALWTFRIVSQIIFLQQRNVIQTFYMDIHYIRNKQKLYYLNIKFVTTY